MRILLVEDEPKVASFIRRGLQEVHHTVDVASSAREGDELASVETYDVMIFDCMLPDGDGRSLCRELRERGVATPVLILTAKSATGDKILGLDSGADDYLTKPFDFSELLARIRALGRRSLPPTLLTLSVGDLTMDPATRRVSRAGRPIALTPKEYSLLELLARRAGNVVTRTEIIERVWDMHFDPSSNVVDVVVKVLRDKVDREFDSQLIKTVRGVGYMLEATP